MGIDKPCYNQAAHVSHIISRRVDDTLENKVLHCVACHTEWHRVGASEKRIEMLQKRRAEQLRKLGKEEFI